MDAEFIAFIGFVIDAEGRTWENDPDDHGNRGDGSPGNIGTKFGIDAESHPGIDIVNLTEDQARQIYWTEWQAEKVECIPHPADLVYYDDCVNAGETDATRILQLSLNSSMGTDLITDGKLGPLTLACAQKADGKRTAMHMLELRDEHYQWIAEHNATEAKYLHGWLNRVADLQNWILGKSIA